MGMSKVTNTSIRIDEDLWKEAKKYAIDKDITMSELLQRALKNEMERGEGC
jgi:post-segregation antitoxin (ccd killing protein)